MTELSGVELSAGALGAAGYEVEHRFSGSEAAPACSSGLRWCWQISDANSDRLWAPVPDFTEEDPHGWPHLGRVVKLAAKRWPGRWSLQEWPEEETEDGIYPAGIGAVINGGCIVYDPNPVTALLRAMVAAAKEEQDD